MEYTTTLPPGRLRCACGHAALPGSAKCRRCSRAMGPPSRICELGCGRPAARHRTTCHACRKRAARGPTVPKVRQPILDLPALFERYRLGEPLSKVALGTGRTTEGLRKLFRSAGLALTLEDHQARRLCGATVGRKPGSRTKTIARLCRRILHTGLRCGRPVKNGPQEDFRHCNECRQQMKLWDTPYAI